MEASIKSVYGSEFHSDIYLRRFFNQRIKLPRPDISHYIDSLSLDFERYEQIKIFPKNNSKNVYADVFAEMLKFDPELNLRDIQRMLDRLLSIVAYVDSQLSQTYKCINVIALFQGIIEHYLNREEFETRDVNDYQTSHLGLTSSRQHIDYYVNFNLACVSTTPSKYQYYFNGRYYGDGITQNTVLAISSEIYGGELTHTFGVTKIFIKIFTNR